MNKYIKGFVNFIIGFVIMFVVILFVWNIMVMGFLFYPDIIVRVDGMLAGYTTGAEYIFTHYFLPGPLPLFYILVMIFVAPVFCMMKTINLINKIDIEKITTLRIHSKAKRKEVKEDG